MSKYINVNPGQYKLRGRERPGHDVLHEQEKIKASLTEHELRELAKRKNQQARRRPAR
jgi:hypothetical protein